MSATSGYSQELSVKKHCYLWKRCGGVSLLFVRNAVMSCCYVLCKKPVLVSIVFDSVNKSDNTCDYVYDAYEYLHPFVSIHAITSLTGQPNTYPANDSKKSL